MGIQDRDYFRDDQKRRMSMINGRSTRVRARVASSRCWWCYAAWIVIFLIVWSLYWRGFPFSVSGLRSLFASWFQVPPLK